MKSYWGQEEKPTEDVKSSEILVKEPEIVEIVDNHIYFYSEIGRREVLRLNKEIRLLANTHAMVAKREEREPAQIFLHINSYGGGLFHGFAAMDEILKQEIPVTTIVDGCCASAATFISIVGKRRLIHSHAYMLIHQLSSMMWGKFSEFQDEMKNLNKLMEMIKTVYSQYTKLPERRIDEILKHDLWFNAKECVEYGLVDEIINEK